MHTSYVDIVTVSPQLRLLTQLTATAGRTGGGGGGGGGGTTTATTTTTTKGAVTTAKSPISVPVPSVPQQRTPGLTKLKRSSSLHSESSSHSYASDCGLVGVGIRGLGGISRSGRGRSSSGRGSGTRTSSDCTVQIIMATQFVKWWKTKFQTMQTTTCGYKNISVLGSDTSDGRPSDTEDLVRDDASSSCNVHGAHVNPGLVASSTSSQHSHDHHLDYSPNEVKFEDFECDVHVEGSESGEERKEFSFTFYDLDGHGKITKDDIAGLVRSIYGAVNDSITVPQGGKKTIKVRLTVTPEKGKYDCGGVSGGKNSSPSPNVPSQNNNNNNNNNNNTTTNNNNNNNNNLSAGTTIVMGNENSSRPNKLRNNVNVTIQENLNRDRKGDGGRRHSDKPKFNSVRLPNHLTCRGCRNLSPEIFRDCSASPLRNRKKWRERACSAQRPDLFELLQANMEKNNVTPCCRQPHHHNSPPLCSHNHLIDPTCPVLPLLNSNHNNNISPPTNNDNLCHSGKLKLQLEHSVCSPRNKFYDSSSHHHRPLTGGGGAGHQNHQCRKHGHHRSRSHDLSQNLFKYHLLSDRDQLFPSSSPHTPNTNSPATALTISASAATSPPLPQTTQATSAPHSPKASSLYNNNHSCHNQLNQNEDALDLLTGCIFNHKNSNIVNSAAAAAAAASPHQLKHRNRKQEHARAMAQVISWLERENIGMEKKFSSPKKMPNPLPVTPPPVKKHEHHHVHEHIHHHYHHYAKETPIIV